jgi:hypothetical protein
MLDDAFGVNSNMAVGCRVSSTLALWLAESLGGRLSLYGTAPFLQRLTYELGRES